MAAILEAAADQIAHEGFAAMTTNRVAARAGVSIGSLYQYFPNKQALLVALLEEHLGALGPVVERSLEEMADPAIPFGEALRRMFVALVGLHDDRPVPWAHRPFNGSTCTMAFCLLADNEAFESSSLNA